MDVQDTKICMGETRKIPSSLPPFPRISYYSGSKSVERAEINTKISSTLCVCTVLYSVPAPGMRFSVFRDEISGFFGRANNTPH